MSKWMRFLPETHRRLRVGLKCNFLPKGADVISFSASTGIGGTTLYDCACNWLPALPFSISHGARGSWAYRNMPRHGALNVDTAGKERLQFDVAGLILGGMPKRDVDAASLGAEMEDLIPPAQCCHFC